MVHETRCVPFTQPSTLTAVPQMMILRVLHSSTMQSYFGQFRALVFRTRLCNNRMFCVISVECSMYRRGSLVSGVHILGLDPFRVRPASDQQKRRLHAGVEYKLNTTVSGANVKAKTLTTTSGDTITYEKLIIATGSTVRLMPKCVWHEYQCAHHQSLRGLVETDTSSESLSMKENRESKCW